MRGRTASRNAITVIALILVAATLFAYLRSRGEPGGSASPRPSGDAAAPRPSAVDQHTLAEQTYRRSCQACHAARGVGRSGLAPALAPLVREVHDAQGGRDYLIQFLLWGSEGEVVINGQAYEDHPPFQHLSDRQLAALLDLMVGGWPDASRQADPPPYSPDQIARMRTSPASPEQVRQLRESLSLGALPR